MQLKKFGLQQISISLSIISIVITVWINEIIARSYIRSHGKTRALFGLIELLEFGYQYYVAIFGIISLVLAIWSINGNSTIPQKIAMILLSLLAIAIVFGRIWRLFV
jgi:hypothetical protein